MNGTRLRFAPEKRTLSQASFGKVLLSADSASRNGLRDFGRGLARVHDERESEKQREHTKEDAKRDRGPTSPSTAIRHSIHGKLIPA